MPERIQCPPETSIILGMVAKPLSLPLASSELIDNACDKGATRIEININSNGFVIEDNGSGVADLKAMLTLGRHHVEVDEDDEVIIGRYGVGFKDAVVWLGRKVEIETRHRGRRRFTNVDWTEVRATGDWGIVFGDFIEEPDQPSFTRITVTSFYKYRTRKMGALPAKLAARFTPGILRGIEIVYNGETLVPLPLPELTDEIFIDDFFDGLHFRMTAGLLVNPQEERHGYQVAYQHRIIRPNDDRDAFGSYSNQRIFGYIDLLDDGEEMWSLSTHKEDFEERLDFYEFLFPRIEPLLKKASEIGDNLVFRELEQAVATRLENIIDHHIRELRNSHGRRTPRQPHPPSEPTGRKRRHATNADERKLGSIEDGRRNKTVIVMFDYLRDGSIGEVQKSQSRYILHLNPSNPLIAGRQEETIAAIGCAMLGISIAHEPDHIMYECGNDSFTLFSKFTQGLLMAQAADEKDE